MNQKGMMFTLMALFLVLGIIAFNEDSMSKWMLESESTKSIDISSVENKYANIMETVILLHTNSYRKEIDERNIPFTYLWAEDSNSIEIKQNIPLNTVDLENYFNFINIYNFYLSDNNYNNVFDGLEIDMNSIKNAPWGGTTEELRFLVKPFCYQYRVNGEEEMILEEAKTKKCSGVFVQSNIARFDITVAVRNFEEDFNVISCSGGACPEDAFNPASTDPYYRIEINDENCGNCNLSQKVISKHFAWGSDNNITIYNDGGSPESTEVKIRIKDDVNISRYGEKSIEIRLKTEFEEDIKSFEFLDFNYTVYSRDGKVRKSNNPLAIE